MLIIIKNYWISTEVLTPAIHTNTGKLKDSKYPFFFFKSVVPNIKHKYMGWGDGSEAESMYCLYRGPEFGSQYPLQATIDLPVSLATGNEEGRQVTFFGTASGLGYTGMPWMA